MKKKNMAKKAVLPALLAVLCSTAALTSVSYAWFTMGNEASVEGIDVNVQAADGMQISVDAVNWKSNLSVSDLKGVVNSNNVMPEDSTELAPVSSVGDFYTKDDDGKVAGTQKMYKGTITNDRLTAVEDASNFVAFDLYVKLDVEKKFSLVKDGTTVTDPKLKNSHLSSRVSFAYFGTHNASKPADALADTELAPNGVKIWEPNSTTHTDFAIGQYGDKIRDKKVDYKGVNAEISTGIDPNGDATELSSVTTFDFRAADSTYVLYDNLGAGISKFRITIWLEGQDVDCNNDASAGQLNVDFKFQVPATPKN